jgi:hypothetical protein
MLKILGLMLLLVTPSWGADDEGWRGRRTEDGEKRRLHEDERSELYRDRGRTDMPMDPRVDRFDPRYEGAQPHRNQRADRRRQRDYHTDRHAHVPAGHMPPRGQCRIWYADRPPGHQPPPGDCRKLERRVPSGARLVYGS